MFRGWDPGTLDPWGSLSPSLSLFLAFEREDRLIICVSIFSLDTLLEWLILFGRADWIYECCSSETSGIRALVILFKTIFSPSSPELGEASSLFVAAIRLYSSFTWFTAVFVCLVREIKPVVADGCSRFSFPLFLSFPPRGFMAPRRGRGRARMLFQQLVSFVLSCLSRQPGFSSIPLEFCYAAKLNLACSSVLPTDASSSRGLWCLCWKSGRWYFISDWKYRMWPGSKRFIGQIENKVTNDAMFEELGVSAIKLEARCLFHSTLLFWKQETTHWGWKLE